MEGHEVYPNIDKPLQFMGRNLGDWIGSLITSMLLYTLVVKPLLQNDVTAGLIFIFTTWLFMTGLTAYRDNMPPHLAHYAMQWMSQGDNYLVKPDTRAIPVLVTPEMLEREEQRVREIRGLIEASQQERSVRRRNGTAARPQSGAAQSNRPQASQPAPARGPARAGRVVSAPEPAEPQAAEPEAEDAGQGAAPPVRAGATPPSRIRSVPTPRRKA